VERLVDDLQRLGVRAGDLLMVHASLRAVGPVELGADGLLDALGTAIGQGGTLLFTLGALDHRAWVNDQPEADRPALLRDAEPFDALHTPADPDVGMLAERFRLRPGTVVSDHPEGRFGASGRLADALVDDVPWDDYYGPGSPLERFVGLGGRALRLGADLDTLTVLHYAEYLAPLPTKRRTRRHRLVRGDDGPQVRTIDCLDDAHGIVDYAGQDYFAAILRAYLATGRARTGRVGHAPSELLDAADVVAFGADWMAGHLTSPTA
jgi:aminoglycoside N3'-acetyltransferase